MKNLQAKKALVVEMIGKTAFDRLAKKNGVANTVQDILNENRGNEYYAQRIAALENKQRQGAVVVIATDADAAGDKLAEEIEALVPGAERQRPASGKDWNEQLEERIEQQEPDHGGPSLG